MKSKIALIALAKAPTTPFEFGLQSYQQGDFAKASGQKIQNSPMLLEIQIKGELAHLTGAGGDVTMRRIMPPYVSVA